MSSIAALKDILNKVERLNQAGAVLDWDQQCYMPPGGAEARAEQQAVIATLHHDLFTSDEVGSLLEKSKAELNGAGPDSDDAALIRVTQREYDRETKVPGSLQKPHRSPMKRGCMRAKTTTSSISAQHSKRLLICADRLPNTAVMRTTFMTR